MAAIDLVAADEITEHYRPIADEVAASAPGVLAVAGPVAVGKSTTAAVLAELLTELGAATAVVAADDFLLPNAVLVERGAIMQKGYPHTYDVDALRAAVSDLRAGRATTTPSYSHDTYDIEAGVRRSVGPVQVTVVEGLHVIAHLDGIADRSVYIHADDEVVGGWFRERFLRLCRAATDRPESFYHPWAGLPDDEIDALATLTWEHINGPNVADHVAPTRTSADTVLTKDTDHRIIVDPPP